MTDRILVTGVSGFIASHVTARLLDQGFAVRGTVRNLIKGQRIVEALEANGSDVSRLELVEADLESDAGWKPAVKDCRFVQHIASPFPLEAPPGRESLVPAARAGAMRVVEQALGAGAERIVMTSSMVAMMGQPGRGANMTVTEDDWSDPDWKPLRAYPVSKTRAERAVWNYAKASNLSDCVTTTNPGLVLGPDTYNNGGASLGLIRAMLSGEFPVVPKVAYPIIDVRDLASLHIKAMTADVGGRRLIGASDTLSFLEIAEIIQTAYPKLKKLPKREMPNWLVRALAIFDDRVKGVLPDLGTRHIADATYVSTLTGVIPRPAREAVLASAKSVMADL